MSAKECSIGTGWDVSEYWDWDRDRKHIFFVLVQPYIVLSM